MSDLKYVQSTETLTWGNEHYKAVSGPHGKGALPAGHYDVLTRNVVTGHGLSQSFRDNNGSAWFIPVSPLFGTTRDGLGIHPDGGIPGTLGCIGLTGTDAIKFWSRWNSLTISARPPRLVVEEGKRKEPAHLLCLKLDFQSNAYLIVFAARHGMVRNNNTSESRE